MHIYAYIYLGICFMKFPQPAKLLFNSSRKFERENSRECNWSFTLEPSSPIWKFKMVSLLSSRFCQKCITLYIDIMSLEITSLCFHFKFQVPTSQQANIGLTKRLLVQLCSLSLSLSPSLYEYIDSFLTPFHRDSRSSSLSQSAFVITPQLLSRILMTIRRSRPFLSTFKLSV